MDLSKLSDQDLLALKSKDYSKLSNDGLLQLRDHAAQTPPQESGLDRAANISRAITGAIAKPINWVRENVPRPESLGSPQQILQSVPEQASRAFGKMGEFGAEQYARMGGNPYAGAAMGTVTAMAPDIAMTVTPEAGAPEAVEAAVPMAEHALGFSKQFRKNSFIRNVNENAARVALEKNVIPWSGSASKMMQNAEALAKEGASQMDEVFGGAVKWKETPIKFRPKPVVEDAVLGGEQIPGQKQIGPGEKSIALNGPAIAGGSVPAPNFPSESTSLFEQTAEVVDPKRMIRELNSLRPKYRGGKYDAAHSMIDEAVNTVRAHGAGKMTLEEANGIKTTLAEDIKYGADGQKLPKKIAATVRNVVDQSLDEVASQIGDPALAQKFRAAKRTYGAAKRMQEGLNNRLSTHGNNIVNPMSVLAGLGMMTGELARGARPLEAVIATGLATGAGMLAKKAGTSVAANLINQAGQAGRMAGPIATTSAALDRLARARKRSQ